MEKKLGFFVMIFLVLGASPASTNDVIPDDVITGDVTWSQPDPVDISYLSYLPRAPRDAQSLGDAERDAIPSPEGEEREEEREERKMKRTKRGFAGGTPGRDFPILDSVPKTDFQCDGRSQGYYADVSAGCQ
ncbi:uncharacterized protein LOC122265140, partial [Penaeus japonicus]|uniref:uncharacterized protein LOC122265140 n=1 Tax=Penaeus japonicus TaxID=27405 RepID=UPI001C7148F3